MASAILLGSCDDDKMEWGTPDGHNEVNLSEIPLALAEKIANYDFIKSYVQTHAPHMTVGIGLGADLYINDADYRQVANDNFQMITTGNAMKHSSVVRNDGSLDFTTIDAFFDAVPSDIKIYGHNFIWHTQQRQSYLKSLIAPEVVVETNDDDVCENIVGNSDFEDGTTNPWGCWGGNGPVKSISEKGEGYESDYAMKLSNPKDGNMWDAQAACTFDKYLEVGTTYVFQFMARIANGSGGLQVQTQNSTTYQSQEGYNNFDISNTWVLCQCEYTCTKDDVDRILINFGKISGDYYIDNFKFGKKIEEKMTNLLGDNGKFEDGTLNSWGGWGNNSSRSISTPGEGYNSDYCMVLTNPADADSWSAQAAYTLPEELVVGKTYMYQAWVKATVENPDFTMQIQNPTTYSGEGYVSISTSTNTWVPFEGEFTCTKEGMTRLCINFGKVAGDYYVDNIKFGEKKEVATPSSYATTRAGGITYKFKSAEEKKEILLTAMEAWIKDMFEHCNGRVKEWDVINEPITDNALWRGIDGNFMSNGDDVPDTAPIEDPNSGLNLNWADDHFYWGYYIGKEYVVKAFEYARKYAPADAMLYVNDYNLETNPGKLATLIQLVDYIEQNGQRVDGIGTQMHVSTNITREDIDAMFKTMAQTGKLIRVTELDVKVGTTTPSVSELAKQAEVYQMIFDSYKEYVPQNQQSGITIWSLTDHKREHEYWISNDAPNIFDASYGRKHAYKGVCDGIAGYDISRDFNGEDWNKNK